MATPIYSYAGFQINASSNGLGYFLVSKNLDMVEYRATSQAIARNDLFKITGWQVAERIIPVEIVVVGTSRTDCEARKDALEAALSIRDGALILHEDGRFWIANATTGKAKFAAGTGIVQCKMPVTFECANPFAVASTPATPFDSGSQAYPLSGGQYVSPTFLVTGGGSAFAYPQLHLINQTPSPGSATLTTGFTAGQTGITSLAVGTGLPALNAGQVLMLVYDIGSPTTNQYVQKVTVTSNTGAGVTPVPVNSFTATYTFPATSTSVFVSTAWDTVQIAQITDNYTMSANSSAILSFTPVGGGGGYTLPGLLPQFFNDTLDIYCDPTGVQGMAIIATINGMQTVLEPIGAFPVLEPTATAFIVTLTADSAPTSDFQVLWSPRWQS